MTAFAERVAVKISPAAIVSIRSCLVSKVATREITEQFTERVALKIGPATMLSIWGCPSCCSRDEENTVAICWTCCLCSYLCVKDRLGTLFTLPFVVSTPLGSQRQAISSRTTASTLFKLFCPPPPPPLLTPQVTCRRNLTDIGN